MKGSEKNTVLIVDDEKSSLEVLISILSPEYSIYMTKNGSSVLAMAEKYLPDVILLDVLMPDMNGFDVFAVLKASEKTQNIPVIFITGLSSTEDEEKGLDLGAADFIHKPFSSKIVQSRVRQQIKIVNQIRVIEKYAQNMQLTAAKMEAIVDNYKGIIWSVNSVGELTSFNGQFLKAAGLEAAFLVWRNIAFARGKDGAISHVDYLEKTFRDGPQSWSSEINGMVFQSHTTPMFDGDGNKIGIVGSTDDITELVKLQQDLKSALEAAESANRTKTAFLANISHEIRTPLNAISGISEIQLQNENTPQELQEAFGRIFNSSDLLLGIINDILDLSKIEAGKLELVMGQYDVASLINDTVFLNMIKYESKPIEFVLSVDENVPSALFGDELRIKQILNNLLSNAFKYTNAGTVELAVSAEVGSDHVTLIFHVRDTGQGMSEEQVAKLFDEYTRFNEGANRVTEGTGLGMSITRNFVCMMKGEIFAKSEIGKGSVLTVRLPQGGVGAPALGKEIAEKLRQFRTNYEVKLRKARTVRVQMPFGKVLVVDDVDMNLYVAKGLLAPYGLQIDTATSGAEAIEKIKRSEYDLVFMDHMMPKMDGVETTQEIRKLGGKYQQIPIVALTANAVSGVKEMFLANGFNDFLSKPIVVQTLDEILRKWLLAEKITRQAEPEMRDTAMDAGDEIQDSFWEELGKIDEINMEIGLRQFSGQREMYRNMLSMFQKKLISDCSTMAAFLEASDIKGFSISVHAMKSLLATIGAKGLSETAFAMETASKNQKADYCREQYPAFKEKLLSLQQRLIGLFPAAEVSSKIGPGDMGALREGVQKAQAAVEEYDNLAGMELIKNLLRYDFGGEINALLESAKAAFEEYQYADAAGVLEKLKKEFIALPASGGQS
jgi:PAS domain S-box-containing protein